MSLILEWKHLFQGGGTTSIIMSRPVLFLTSIYDIIVRHCHIMHSWNINSALQLSKNIMPKIPNDSIKMSCAIKVK